jgi:predicted MFS family arabinose efflux permease
MAVIIFSIGETFFGATWFSLMHPVVPEFIRGRFWGKLRLTWQSMGIIFFLSSALLLGKDSSLRSYQIILSSLTLAYAVRVLFYRRIPELDKVGKSSTNLLTAFRDLFNNPKYLCFCGYVFIVIFFSQGSLRLFSLIEKQVLNLADGYIVGLGVCMMVGMVLGFYLSGKLIDRFGTKELFLICHLSFAFFILMFVFRMGSGLVLVIFLGIITLLFGITRAGTSVAITSEMMGLIPEKNKSLSISVCITMVLVSSGLSGIMNSIIIKLGVLRKHWEFAGFEFSNYDSILLGYSIMLFLLISTIGLVPAIISDSRLRYIGKV